MVKKWEKLGFDIDGEFNNDLSGYSVSLNASGTIVAIGSPINNGIGKSVSGQVRVYQLNTTNNWVQLGQDIEGEFSYSRSGYSVSLNAAGTIVAIGALYNDGIGKTQSGLVRVYQLNTNNNWVQLGEDIDGEASFDISGYSVSLNDAGTIVAIGAPRNDSSGKSNSGSVRVYQLNTTNNWVHLGQDIDGEFNEDYLGWSVSLNADGNRVAIGAPNNDGIGNNSGHIRVYQLDTTSNNWIKLGEDIDGEFRDDESGSSVSLNADGNRVAIGAQRNDGNGNNSGHVRVYQLDTTSNNWIKLGQDIDGELSNDFSGYSVSLNAAGTIVAIGAQYNDGIGNNGIIKSNSGHIRVYQLNASNNWVQIGEDIDGELSNDNSGSSVSLNANGTIVAIGAPNNDGHGNSSGQVCVYQLVKYTAPELITLKFTASQLKEAGYTVSELKAANYTATELKAANYTATELKEAGYTATELKAANYTATEMRVGGYTAKELRASNFTLVEINAAGYTESELQELLISNICFRRGTPISTNQGIIAIEKINPSIHTIRNKKIVYITKTITRDKYLVCFEKNALGHNIPSQKTVMSQSHCVFYKGLMIQAKKFIGKVENVNKIKYSGEILYNVLMENPDKMVVNNLICETLHPENWVAKLYTYFKDFKPSEQQMIIKKVNECNEAKNTIFFKNFNNDSLIVSHYV